MEDHARAIAAVARRMVAAEASILAARHDAVLERLTREVLTLRADLWSSVHEEPASSARSGRQRARAVGAAGERVAQRVHATLCEEAAACAECVLGLASTIDVLVEGSGQQDVPPVLEAVQEVAMRFVAEGARDQDADEAARAAGVARIAALLGVSAAERALHLDAPTQALIEEHVPDQATIRVRLEAELGLMLGRLLLPIDDVISFLAGAA